MPADPRDPSQPAPIARAMAAEARADVRLRDETFDLFLPASARLGDRLRADLVEVLRATVGAIERELRLGAARRLLDMGASEAAEAMVARADAVLERLWRTRQLQSAALMRELIGAVRLMSLAQALPAAASAGADRPSLVVRLAECPEPDVAHAAGELLTISNVAGAQVTLSAPHRAKLVWLVAAALRGEIGGEPRADHTLADVASELISARADEDGVDAASLRLAEVIAARPNELAGLLVETLGDRRPALFVALLAVASGLGFGDTRAIVTDPDGARLWLLLRAQGLERPVIARIGVAMADGEQDLERLADGVDEVMAVDAEAAAASFTVLALPTGYRRALKALGDA